MCVLCQSCVLLLNTNILFCFISFPKTTPFFTVHCYTHLQNCHVPAGHEECIQILLEAGATIDCLDAKAQTPLFVSLVNQHWSCARLLLQAGADPNGSPANLCSPLSIVCQRGFYPGTEWIMGSK